ncbi:MAG: hypothetical protein R3Y19_02480 [Rikenellaceae bacterium]
MKTLKTLALTLTCLFTSLSLMAQPQQRQNMTAEERAEQQTEHMTEELSLSKDQQKKVYAIILEFSEAQEKARAEGGQQGGGQQGGGQGGERGQGGPNPEMMKELDAKIAEVLTKEQQEKYAEMQEKRREGRGQGGQGGGRGGRE